MNPTLNPIKLGSHAGQFQQATRTARRTPGVLSALLTCGVLAALVYAAMNVFVPMLYRGYSSVSQTVSELSAIGAPTRTLWFWLGIPYTVLVVAFGCGLWIAGRRNQALRITGALFILHGLIGPFWPPMHRRGAEISMTDTLHIVFAAINGVAMFGAIAFGAAAFGKRFRAYSLLIAAIMLVFGILTGIEGPRVQANLPTPWLGVWERTIIVAFLFWVVTLANATLTACKQDLKLSEHAREGEDRLPPAN